MSVAYVVVAKDAERTLEACLGSVRARDERCLDRIIVVDNGSRDRTIELARRHADVVVTLPALRIGQLRNAGAGIAEKSNEILAFLDSDCVAPARWGEEILSAVARNPRAIHGCRYSLPERPAWVESAWHHERPVEPGAVKYVPAGGLVIPAELFRELGRFDEELGSGEDQELCRRARAAGVQVLENPALAVTHLGNPKTLLSFFRQQRWHGRGSKLLYPDGSLSLTTIAGLYVLLTVAATVLVAPAVLVFPESRFGLGVLLLGAWLGVAALALWVALERCAYKLKLVKWMRLVPVVSTYLFARGLAYFESLFGWTGTPHRRR